MRNDGELPIQRTLIVIAGATCSGKTTVARALATRLRDRGACVLAIDAYYRDLSHLTFEKRCGHNFDHPDAIDWALLHTHVEALLRGQAVTVPRYDFATHSRMPEGESLDSAAILIVEGLLALHMPKLRALASLRVYIDVPEEIALTRRLARDVRDRGRTPESVRAQFRTTVQPMADAFVAPTRTYADLVLRCDMPIEDSIEVVLGRLVL